MRVFHPVTLCLLTTIALSLSTPQVRAQSIPQAEPTCYLKRLGRQVERLDHLCGVNDPKPDRRRSPYELDKDGMPFVMKENFQTVKDLQTKLVAAQQRLEAEVPLSDTAKQLLADQKALFNQYASIKTAAEAKVLQQRLEANYKKIKADPTINKSHEMMGKLYQRNR